MLFLAKYLAFYADIQYIQNFVIKHSFTVFKQTSSIAAYFLKFRWKCVTNQNFSSDTSTERAAVSATFGKDLAFFETLQHIIAFK